MSVRTVEERGQKTRFLARRGADKPLEHSPPFQSPEPICECFFNFTNEEVGIPGPGGIQGYVGSETIGCSRRNTGVR